LTFAGIVVAAIYGAVQIYDNSPSDFIVKIDPNTEIHVCIIDGQFIFDEA
jgi:hypothetical protein